MHESVIGIFSNLAQTPPDDDSIVSKASPRNNQVFLGVDRNSDFLVMFKDDHGVSRPSRKLRFLSVDYGMVFKTLDEGNAESGRYTCVRLQNANSEYFEAFSRLAELLINEVSKTSESQEIRKIVDDFIELFAPKPGVPRDRIKGLFGELAVISSSEHEDEMIRAWHAESNANKDFTFVSSYLEVKTSESDQRKHSVGAKQLWDPDKSVFLCSVTIQEDPTGISVFDLMDALRARATSENQIKLVRNVFEAIGLDAAEAEELKFSLLGEPDAIHVYAAEVLPTAQPVGNPQAIKSISNIQFDINLTTAEAAGIKYMSLHQWFEHK